MTVPDQDAAKVVACLVDGLPIEAVVPATMAVNLERLLALAGGSEIRLAREDEFPRLFPEGESGAASSSGPIHSRKVFVDVSLAAEPTIVFSGALPSESVGMRWAAFARTVRPIVGAFAERTVDAVGAFRLSAAE